ncbi:MAG: short-chain dehydrogenase [Devosia sp. 63-57]|nr:SDR family NAD(P)-dependent oxidoreductase [uncultured Devosia sp.]ODT47193.1 MAG: short-chain dehydrogenase [Pelagibacterium sp. SCN 63-126]ODU89008.1 MAG: short-chain dehydrogenase [Pelagibacterium sp. SCN 63-17]OJX43095.1 MAG: short-chain dehydrogenase [Devosia sp. 63-57]
MLIKGMTAVLTGAAAPDGIGFATARRFVEEGARVAILDLSQEDCARAAESLRAIGGPDAAIGAAVDVRDREGLAQVAQHLQTTFGKLDILVNNAGIAQKRRLEEVSAEDWHATLDVNLMGMFNATQAMLPLMTDGGAIVSVASIAAQRGGGLLGGPHYAASKGGVLALTKSLARELGPRRIRANAVNPGVIITSMNRTAFDAATQAGMVASIPLGRFGSPEDVARVCLFLASDLSAYVTGTAVDINGGMHMH